MYTKTRKRKRATSTISGARVGDQEEVQRVCKSVAPSCAVTALTSHGIVFSNHLRIDVLDVLNCVFRKREKAKKKERGEGRREKERKREREKEKERERERGKTRRPSTM